MAARSSSARFSSLVRRQSSASAVAVRDELRVRVHHGVDDAQPVGAQRRARFGDLDDRVGEHRRLHFRRAPRELDVDVDLQSREVRLGRPSPAPSRSSCLRDPAASGTASRRARRAPT